MGRHVKRVQIVSMPAISATGDHVAIVCMACNKLSRWKIEVRLHGLGVAQTLRLCQEHWNELMLEMQERPAR